MMTNSTESIPISPPKLSAEDLAIARLKDEDDPSQWVTLVEAGEDIDVEKDLEYLKKRGYKIQISS
jgi:hypothetical protein